MLLFFKTIEKNFVYIINIYYKNKVIFSYCKKIHLIDNILNILYNVFILIFSVILCNFCKEWRNSSEEV